MITTDKVTEMFCILDEFCKNLDADGTFLSECLSRTGVKYYSFINTLGSSGIWSDKIDKIKKKPL